MDARSEFEELATLMLGRASTEVEEAVGASLDDRVRQSLELSQHGEGVIAFENLIDNLDEFSISISAEEYELFLDLGRRWSVPERRMRMLDTLRLGPD